MQALLSVSKEYFTKGYSLNTLVIILVCKPNYSLNTHRKLDIAPSASGSRCVTAHLDKLSKSISPQRTRGATKPPENKVGGAVYHPADQSRQIGILR